MALRDNQILLIILAVFIAPLAVFLYKENCDKDVIINLILCLFFYLPAVIHAVWIIMK